MHIRADKLASFHEIAARLCAPDAKARFQGVTDRLIELKLQPVPWWVIAVIAEREYGGPPHWDRQLGQGDPLNKKSTHVPKGRGPFLSQPDDVTPGHDAWTRCAVDALVNCDPFAAKNADWSVGGVLTLLESFNGMGYAMRNVPSAYVWSGTDQYISGKFVKDHVYRKNVVDIQEGCAPILVAMAAIDPSVRVGAPLDDSRPGALVA